jgi:phenylpropionate dioxygenase-like ring-hydroxylating dioxygenase large terminal subunit
MPSSQEFRSVKGVPRLKTKIINNLVYVNPFYDLNNIDIINNYKIPSPYMPPEHFDNRFIKINGERMINKNTEIVTENLLDMLHISTVHSFGNTDWPLPFNIKHDDIDMFSGRTKFKYKSGNFSISKRVASEPEVTVENEYHLPTTTITRVKANDLVKVVMTNILPISEDKSIMYWTIYRNFWTYPIPQIGDMVMKYFMDKTIDEDIGILKNIYSEDRIGNIDTKYDITINKYRNAKRKFRDNL